MTARGPHDDASMESEWAQRLAEAKASGQGPAEVAQAHGVAPSTVYSWSRRVRKNAAEVCPPAADAPPVTLHRAACIGRRIASIPDAITRHDPISTLARVIPAAYASVAGLALPESSH